MFGEPRPARSLILFEGQVKWIMERETPEEKLAAWEALTQIAFPQDEDSPFQPPPLPVNGEKMSPCDKAKRDVYNLFKDIIESRAVKYNGKLKDIRKVEAGRLGAAVRYGRRMDSSDDSGVVDLEEDAIVTETNASDMQKEKKAPTARIANLPQSIAEDDFSNINVAGKRRDRRTLSKEDKEAIAEWDRKIPDADALQQYLQKNFLHATRATAIKPEFCQYAYHKLAKVDRWISTRDNRPLRDIRIAVHYIALDYIKQLGEVKRVEEEERRKNIESEYNLKTAEQNQQMQTELAAIERKRRRKAEREATEKIMKGEL